MSLKVNTVIIIIRFSSESHIFLIKKKDTMFSANYINGLVEGLAKVFINKKGDYTLTIQKKKNGEKIKCKIKLFNNIKKN